MRNSFEVNDAGLKVLLSDLKDVSGLNDLHVRFAYIFAGTHHTKYEIRLTWRMRRYLKKAGRLNSLKDRYPCG